MHSSVLAIDTEFLREKTYYAKLCLIQLATDDETAIVDPFAVDDLKVLAPVLRNENVMKLFHAGNQDLEILLREVGVLPHPLFDTRWPPRSWAIRSRSATRRSCMPSAA